MVHSYTLSSSSYIIIDIYNTQIKKVNLKKYKNLKKLSVTKEVKVIGYKGKKTIYDETL